MNKRTARKILNKDNPCTYTKIQYLRAIRYRSRASRGLFAKAVRRTGTAAQKAADSLHNVTEVVKLIVRNRVRNMEGIIKVEYE